MAGLLQQQLTPSQVGAQKKRIQNSDGSVSTERSITIGVDDGYVNIPTIIGGRQLSEEEAIAHYKSGGEASEKYPSIDAAVSAAKQRSEAIGRSLNGGTNMAKLPKFAQEDYTVPGLLPFMDATKTQQPKKQSLLEAVQEPPVTANMGPMNVEPPVQPLPLPLPQMAEEPDPMDPVFKELMRMADKPEPGPDPEAVEAQKLAAGKVHANIEDQRKGLDETQKILEQYGKAGIKGEVNLAPLLGLVDSWTGSNFSKNYVPPEVKSPEERALDVAKMKTALAKSRGDLTSQEIDLLKQTGVSKTKSQDKDLERAMGIARLMESHEKAKAARSEFKISEQRRGEQFDTKLTKELSDDIIKKLSDPFIEKEKEFTDLQQTMGTRNLNEVYPMLSQYAKSVGGQSGALAEGDIKRTLADSLGLKAAEVEYYVTGSKNVKVPPDAISGLMNILTRVRQNHINAAKAQASLRRNIYGASRPDLMAPGAPGDAMVKVYEDLISKAEQGTAAQPSQPVSMASAQGMSADQKRARYEELMRKKTGR